MADFNKLVELVTDFGVESLRVGSYEARKALVGCDNWKLSMLRDKRQEARERVVKALWEVFNPQSPTDQRMQIGWLYDWTHSSALEKPDEHFTSFTTDEAHARKHDNVRPVWSRTAGVDVPGEGKT